MNDSTVLALTVLAAILKALVSIGKALKELWKLIRPDANERESDGLEPPDSQRTE